jgi:hypothetical protein
MKVRVCYVVATVAIFLWFQIPANKPAAVQGESTQPYEEKCITEQADLLPDYDKSMPLERGAVLEIKK